VLSAVTVYTYTHVPTPGTDDLKSATFEWGDDTQEFDMNPLQSLLHVLADPNIAFILFSLGFYGLLFELAHPNLLTGTVGGISIVLAVVGFGSLPLNLGGLLLIGLGVILFGVDLHITNHGVPTVGGLICFVLRRGRALYRARHSGTAVRGCLAGHRDDDCAYRRVHGAHRLHRLEDAKHAHRARPGWLGRAARRW